MWNQWVCPTLWHHTRLKKQQEEDVLLNVAVQLYSISALVGCLLSNQIAWAEQTVV